MKKILISLSLSLLFLVGCSTTPTFVSHGIPNLRTVDSTKNILRGGQPNTNGFAYLKSIGITNIIKLNTAREGSDDYAKTLGMRVVYIPLDVWAQTVYTPLWKVNMAVTNITFNTFFHCKHGEDRTGLIGKAKRISDGMSEKDSDKEMMDDGFHEELFGLYWRSKHLK